MRYSRKMQSVVGVLILVFGVCAVLYGWLPKSAPSVASGEQRIVSVGGNVTEILYAIGLGDVLVATDSTSTYPDAANQLPKIGYMRTLSVEGVLSLKPTLLVLSGEAGPENVIAQIKSTGIPVLVLPKAHTVDNIHESISLIGAATKHEAQAAELSRRLKVDWQVAQQSKTSGDKKVLFVMSHTGNLTVAGRDTAADAVLKLAGLNNIAHDAFTGYKALNAESLFVNQPDVIITTQESLDGMGGMEALLAKAGVAQTIAAKQQHVVVMPAMYLLGFGPRFGLAMQDLHAKLQDE